MKLYKSEHILLSMLLPDSYNIRCENVCYFCRELSSFYMANTQMLLLCYGLFWLIEYRGFAGGILESHVHMHIKVWFL